MLGAALAPAAAGGLAVQLRHHGLEVRALGDGVAMAPVGALDIIRLFQAGAHAGGHRLLTHIQVDIAQDLLGFPGTFGLQLKFADLHHGLIVPQQFLF